MIAAQNYVGTFHVELLAHVAVSARPCLAQSRACRLVVMPEWPGAGVGLRFLYAVFEHWRRGDNRYNKSMPTLVRTSRPASRSRYKSSPA